MRPSRLVQPRERDPYRVRAKTKDASVCSDCGVVFHGGRWYRGTPPLCRVLLFVCPACRRIRDRYPAGTIRLRGEVGYVRDEVLPMLRHVAEAEKAQHPLERIMDVEEADGEVRLTTTGIHLARCIASALKRRFHKDVEIEYMAGESLIRVDWRAPEPTRSAAPRSGRGRRRGARA